MKYENLMNIFAPNVTSIDLTERDLEFIAMFTSGIETEKAAGILSMTEDDIEEFYLKFGLTDKNKNRDCQVTAISCFNNLITDEISDKVYKKYNLPECGQNAEMQRNAPEYDRKHYEDMYETSIGLYKALQKKASEIKDTDTKTKA